MWVSDETRSRQEADTLRAIVDLTKELGWAPSITELGERLGLSSRSTVHHRLMKLKESGLIAVGGRGSPRSLRLTEEGMACLSR